jgi:hypothetical protein
MNILWQVPVYVDVNVKYVKPVNKKNLICVTNEETSCLIDQQELHYGVL